MYSSRQQIGLLLGPALFLILLLIPTPEGMPPAAMQTAAVVALMAVWWVSEALPLPVTALLPIVLFPLLDITPATQVTRAYAHHIIFLFLGGFLIAIAIERWQLHRRIALLVLRLVGTRPDRLLFGFMFVTAFLSSWISNTASTLMMVTIGTAVLTRLSENGSKLENGLGTALMLGIAYAASIGGIATLIGTPPNAILAGIMESSYGVQIGFMEWMVFALPLSLAMLVITWLYLSRFAYRLNNGTQLSNHSLFSDELHRLGPMSSQEKRVLFIFLLVVTGWIGRGFVDIPMLKGITDSTIAIAGALLLFITPSGRKPGERLLDWQSTAKVPWDILILFGGGLALAGGVADSGLSTWLGEQMVGLAGMPLPVMIGLLVLMVVFLTEVSSNTATASLLLPVLGGFAVASGIPAMTLMAATALAASFAFMLPVATPPNAIVFSSRKVTLPQMARAGIWLNLIGTLLITVAIAWLLPLVWRLST
ncbi:anion transporter [Solemya pervernicosa gill symbiont]|uniref:Anion transporter n=1 Tax=Solemya pervernicosa gill symbiont TaxID=642797 RepID=A0A1T2L7C3_9GAMM|nr:DASS family sodium-coupled anion symporter [Solemya pervernicosa gill symbiont]OOZ41009.1 anion transporter [Solemya pervernicosa gill symbiont]